ncbi:MAG: hypothetical protein Q8L75_00910 [Acidobacteriota bacterium]|nr:hypothetical protein [Acidobacteriota bacterium]
MERVLVCVTCSTRGHEVTFPSFKRQVLDPLQADLALAVAIDETYDEQNPFWQHAMYRWTTPDYNDYGRGFDEVQRSLWPDHAGAAPDWRSLHRINGIWLGGIQSPDPQPSASAILPICRALLRTGLQQDGILDRYDRFVITRSDFVWRCPHPPLSVLAPDAIWIPDGENHDGLADRHVVVSRDEVLNCLDLIDAILLQPEQLYEEMKHNPHWNNEQVWMHHLRRKGLLDKVRRFPYVMYLARAKGDDSPTWSRGRYDAALGHFVKYETEFALATAYATVIRTREDWESGSWRQFDPASVAPPPVSVASRLMNAWYELGWALKRPGRMRRFWNAGSRLVRRNAPDD